MIRLRKSKDRGHAHHGWLKTFHTFSFADYYDPDHRHFRTLRVINEDYIEPANGFETHAHEDMEILTYLLEGQLEHRDSMGNHFVIQPGEVQRMTAGTGVEHSEKNPSPDQATHLLQIWIFPEKKGLKPGYEQKKFNSDSNPDRLIAIASPDASEGSLKIHQDVRLFAAHLGPKKVIDYDISRTRHAWLQMISGTVNLNGNRIKTGDGAAISEETRITLAGEEPSHFLLFDLA